MRHHRYDRSDVDFVMAPGQPRQEIRNPERTVGRWMVALAIAAGLLVLMGVI